MGILDDLIYGYRDLYDADGALLPRRTKLRVLGEGVTAVDNPVTGQTELTLAGGGPSTPSAIVVDRAINLTAFGGTQTIAANSITVSYGAPPEGRPEVGTMMLVLDDRSEPSGAGATGWYEVTAVSPVLTLTRVAGLTAGTEIDEGRETVCRDASKALSSLVVGDVVGSASGVYEWVVNRAGVLASEAPAEPVGIVPVVEAATVGHTHALAGEMGAGFMSGEQATALSELASTRPIVVDYAIAGSALPGSLSYPDSNTISGTGAFVGTGKGVLLIGTTELSGWYDVTASDGSVWTMSRMEGTTHGSYVPPGRMTLCRDTWGDAEPIYCWVTPGGEPLGYDPEPSPQITPKMLLKAACSDTKRPNSRMRGTSRSSRIMGIARYQQQPWL